MLRRILSPILLVAILCVFPSSVLRGSSWVIGDVFVGLSSGLYKVYSNSGVFKETIGSPSSFGTGCAFNPGKTAIYTTAFSSSVVAFDVVHPHGLLQTISDPGVESVVFTAAGDFYTGGPGKQIKKFNAAGALQQTYTQVSGSDWVEVASDQVTLFYDEEGTTIRRLNASGAGSQLANFSTVGSSFFALRLLPPGDGSAGLLVANGGNVLRLNSSGAIVQTYTAPGVSLFFALNLDPNGTSFWSADLFAGNFYRFNIASGAIEVGPISAGSEVGGLCLLGEPTGGTGFGGAACPAHAHGHVSTGAPGHFAGISSPHAHHAQHGTHLIPNTCPPHAFGHHPLSPDTGEGLFTAGATEDDGEQDFIAALNQDGFLKPAARGTVVQLFGSAKGLFLDDQDQQSAMNFAPPSSGSPLYYTTSVPEVRIGGAKARVLFSGLAPGLTGVWQINIVVPDGVPSGRVPVEITYDGQELESIDIEVR